MSTKAGRKSSYTKELGDQVCETIATHVVGIDKLHSMYPDFFPEKRTIFRWVYDFEAFRHQYLEARKMQAHILADYMLDIADNIPTYADREYNERIDAGMLGRARLDFEAKKWHASKLEPKIYGDNKQIDELNTKNEELQEELNKIRNELNAGLKKEY